MSMRSPRYNKSEHARRGRELYETRIKSQVEAGHHGKIVAIDIDTGEFEISEDSLSACEQLIARRPDAQIWVVRIGHPGVYKFGPRLAKGAR